MAVVLESENHLFIKFHNVCRAAHTQGASVVHIVYTSHGCARFSVTQDFLDRVDFLDASQ